MDDCVAFLRLCGRDRGDAASALPRARPVIRFAARATERGRRVPAPCRDRPACDDRPRRENRQQPPWRPSCDRVGIRHAADDTWSDMLSRVLVEKVEPNLGMGRITILDRYPAAEAALARRTPDDPRVAERFELYACGVELANGFGELTEPRRTAPPLRDGDGRERARLWRALSGGRGFSCGPRADARRPRAWRLALTGW